MMAISHLISVGERFPFIKRYISDFGNNCAGICFHAVTPRVLLQNPYTDFDENHIVRHNHMQQLDFIMSTDQSLGGAATISDICTLAAQLYNARADILKDYREFSILEVLDILNYGTFIHLTSSLRYMVFMYQGFGDGDAWYLGIYTFLPETTLLEMMDEAVQLRVTGSCQKQYPLDKK